MVEADIHLRLVTTSIADIYNMFELLGLTNIWEHPYTIKQAKLAPDFGI
jgi:hypothetical protein